MKILIVDQSMVRGFAERACSIVNSTCAGYEARCLVRGLWSDHSTWNGAFNPVPPVYSLREKRHIDDCIAWADLVHFLQATSWRTIGYPNMIGRKPTVWQLFAAVSERWEVYGPIWEKDDYAKIRFALVAEGWQRDPFWCKRPFMHLPGLFTINDPLYQPVPISERKRIVSFAPMARRSVAAPKGYSAVQKTLKGMPLDLIHRRPFAECMDRKAHAWIGIDELETSIVHFSLFEYLSLGVPAISKHDQISLDAIKDATGAASAPIIQASYGNLRTIVSDALAANETEWAERGASCRKWMETYYAPERCIQRYIDFWNKG